MFSTQFRASFTSVIGGVIATPSAPINSTENSLQTRALVALWSAHPTLMTLGFVGFMTTGVSSWHYYDRAKSILVRYHMIAAIGYVALVIPGGIIAFVWKSVRRRGVASLCAYVRTFHGDSRAQHLPVAQFSTAHGRLGLVT
jgi:hypothetical protein